MTTEPVRAAIVTVGDELLFGETVDTNAAWLGRWLARLGIPLARRFTVADDAVEIERALEHADADLVLVSGGLGPTRDDLTRDAVAAWTGRPLRLDETLLAALRERFRRRGMDELPAPNLSQAMVPEGATVLDNAYGTAPGLLVPHGTALLVLLPGVPRELRGIVEDGLEPELRARFGDRLRPTRHRLIHTTGIPESRLAELAEPALGGELGPVTVAFLPDLRGVDLRLTARGVGEQEAERWLERVEAMLEPVVRPWRFEAASGDLVEAVSDELLRGGRTLAVAESCTGGLVAQRMTERAGSSRVFVGGVVAYDNAVKTALLGVSAEVIEQEGAVSKAVALGMALGVAERLGSSAGLSVTGVAGPGGGTPAKPVGTVWLGVALDGVAEARLARYVGDRSAIRERAAQDALSLLYRALRQGSVRPDDA